MRKGIILVLVMSINLAGCQGYSQWKKSVEICKQVKIGMTEAELRQVLQGVSVTVSTSSDGKKDYWYLSSYSLAAEPPRCVVDKNAKRVIQIVCDDIFEKH